MKATSSRILEAFLDVLKVARPAVLARAHNIPRAYIYAFKKPRKNRTVQLGLPAFAAIARMIGGDVTSEQIRADYVARGGYRGKRKAAASERVAVSGATA